VYFKCDCVTHLHPNPNPMDLKYKIRIRRIRILAVSVTSLQYNSRFPGEPGLAGFILVHILQLFQKRRVAQDISWVRCPSSLVQSLRVLSFCT